jgi:hypothetical protein
MSVATYSESSRIFHAPRDVLAANVCCRRSTHACSFSFVLLNCLFARIHDTQSLVFSVRRPDKITRTSWLRPEEALNVFVQEEHRERSDMVRLARRSAYKSNSGMFGLARYPTRVPPLHIECSQACQVAVGL